jgi:hypothetical protein
MNCASLRALRLRGSGQTSVLRAGRARERTDVTSAPAQPPSRNAGASEGGAEGLLGQLAELTQDYLA